MGKTIGIFLRPFYFYKKLNFLNKLRYIKHLPGTWKTDVYLFHEYFLNRFKLLDSALCIDENFVSCHPYYQWLPDVFQTYADKAIGNKNIEQRVWIKKLEDFKQENKYKFIFLYFGTAQKRRGYDLLLKMAVEKEACFVHCGLNNSGEKYDFDIEVLKKNLHKKGRLLETNQYISDPLCIEYFFKSVDRLILPYFDFLGSSGVMLQALGYGIPVLVPDKGIMGYRIKKYNLGLTYTGDIISLENQFNRFKEMPTDLFSNSISNYMKYQNPGQLEKALINVFTGCNKPIMHP